MATIAAFKKVITIIIVTNDKDKLGCLIFSFTILNDKPIKRIRKNKKNGIPPMQSKNLHIKNKIFFLRSCKINVLLILIAILSALKLVALPDEFSILVFNVFTIIF